MQNNVSVCMLDIHLTINYKHCAGSQLKRAYRCLQLQMQHTTSHLVMGVPWAMALWSSTSVMLAMNCWDHSRLCVYQTKPGLTSLHLARVRPVLSSCHSVHFIHCVIYSHLTFTFKIIWIIYSSPGVWSETNTSDHNFLVTCFFSDIFFEVCVA